MFSKKIESRVRSSRKGAHKKRGHKKAQNAQKDFIEAVG